MWIIRLISFLSLFIGIAISVDAHAISLDWEIGNRFRAFDFLANENPEESAKLFKEYAPDYQKFNSESARNLKISDWIQKKVSENTVKSPFGERKTGPWDEMKGQADPNYKKEFVRLPVQIQVTFKLKKDHDSDNIPHEYCNVLLNNKLLGRSFCDEEMTFNTFDSSGGEVTFVSNEVQLFKSEFIKPELMIILGLGDSYAAGEGVPDVSTKWRKGINNVGGNAWAYSTNGPEQIENNKYVISNAEWYSTRCNRSFFSDQSLAALKVATTQPHKIVSFVHLACAGAEVVDGLLAAQRTAPGSSANCQSRSEGNLNHLDIGCDVPTPQITAAVELLCTSKPLSISQDQELENRINNSLNGIRTNKHQTSRIHDELKICSPTDNFLKPDLVFISIGGNDVGFGGAVTWAALPVRSQKYVPLSKKIVKVARVTADVVCPSKKSGYCASNELKNPVSAEERIVDLPQRYEALNIAIKDILRINDPKKVVITNYPNPLYDSKGKYCGNPVNSKEKNQWSLLKFLFPPIVLGRHWEVNLTSWEADQVNQYLIPTLNQSVIDAATKNAWKYADLSNVMDNRGWCTDNNGDYKTKFYTPKSAYTWNAYANNKRMIRTSNDSVLSQWRGKEFPDFIGGTVHPNLQGYAGMADKLFDVLDQ